VQRRQPNRAQVSDPHVSINVFRASLRNRSCFSRALRVLAVARGTRKGACVLFCHLGCYTSGGGLVAVCPQTSPWNAERSPFWLPPVRCNCGPGALRTSRPRLSSWESGASSQRHHPKGHGRRPHSLQSSWRLYATLVGSALCAFFCCTFKLVLNTFRRVATQQME
jgi:hypothetical protein